MLPAIRHTTAGGAATSGPSRSRRAMFRWGIRAGGTHPRCWPRELPRDSIARCAGRTIELGNVVPVRLPQAPPEDNLARSRPETGSYLWFGRSRPSPHSRRACRFGVVPFRLQEDFDLLPDVASFFGRCTSDGRHRQDGGHGARQDENAQPGNAIGRFRHHGPRRVKGSKVPSPGTDRFKPRVTVMQAAGKGCTDESRKFLGIRCIRGIAGGRVSGTTPRQRRDSRRPQADLATSISGLGFPAHARFTNLLAALAH